MRSFISHGTATYGMYVLPNLRSSCAAVIMQLPNNSTTQAEQTQDGLLPRLLLNGKLAAK